MKTINCEESEITYVVVKKVGQTKEHVGFKSYHEASKYVNSYNHSFDHFDKLFDIDDFYEILPVSQVVKEKIDYGKDIIKLVIALFIIVLIASLFKNIN